MHGGRVAILETYPHLYAGAHRVTEALLQHLPDHGWSGRVVLPADGVAVDRFRAAGVEVVVVDAPPALLHYGGASLRGASAARSLARLPGYWRRLASQFAATDIVHLLDPRGMVLGGAPARLARRPVVWQLHTTSGWAAVNAVGSALAHEVVGMSSASVEAMPAMRWSAVEPPPRTVTATTTSEPAALPTVAMVARMHPEKGIDVMVRAWASVVEAVPLARLRVVGCDLRTSDDDYAETVRSLIERTGTGASIEFLGWVEDPSSACADAWLYVQPSRSESYGLSVVDAMASGLPVIVTEVPGLREHVDDGVTGRVVPDGDADALARATIDLLEDRAGATELGLAARRAAPQLAPTPDEHAARWARRYDRLRRR